MTIGKVASRTGVGIETIRFYERKGLINEPPRRDSGYRLYDTDVIDRLSFIQQAKSLGFTLEEISQLLSISLKSGEPLPAVKKIARKRLQDIEEKLKLLRSMKRTLKKLVDACPGKGTIDDCPILETLGRKRIQQPGK